jgi:regulatory protein
VTTPVPTEFQRARDLGLAYLAGRARSVHEMRQTLEQKGVAAEIGGQVIAEFTRLGLLDDRKLARDLVEVRLERQPAATARLGDELRQRGLEPAVVAEVLAEFGAVLDSAETAKELLRRQSRRYAGLDEVKARRRMFGFLARRGYDQDTVQAAVDAVWKELRRDDIEGD